MWSSIKKFWQKVRKDPDKYLLIALAATVPLERIPSYHLGGINLRLSMLVGLVLIIRASYQLLRGKVRLRLSWPILMLIGYMIWILLLGPAAVSKARALVVIGSTGYVLALAFAIGLLYNKKYLDPIIKTVLIVTALVCGFAIFQYLGDMLGVPNTITGLQVRYQWPIFGYPRVQGTLLEPLYLSAYLLLPISLVSAKLLLERKLSGWRWYLASLFLSSYILFLAVSRGGTVAMVVLISASVIGYVLLKKFRSGRIWWYVAAMIVAYGLSLLTFSFVNKPAFNTLNKNTGVSSYSNQISNLAGEGDSRGATRQLGIKYFRQHPVAGIGPGQFGVYAKIDEPSDFPGYPIVNNEPIEILAESGIVGLILILGFFGGLVWLTIKQLWGQKKLDSSKVVQLALLGFLGATAVQYQSYSTIYITTLWFVVGLLYGISGMLLRQRSKPNRLEAWLDRLLAWAQSVISQHWVLLLIVIGFGLLHIYKLNAPILDTHAWRQADTLAVARNFLEESANIFYPRIDIRQTYSGITGMEFPLYNYLVFLSAKVVGLHFWLARAWSVLFGLLGIGFLYGLLRRRYSQAAANWGAFFMAASPLWFYFARNVQPDTMMVAFSVGSLYLMQRFKDSAKQLWFVASVLLLSVAMLVKLPAVFVLLPLAVIAWEGRKALRAWMVIVASAVVAAPSIVWYQHAKALSDGYGLGRYFYEGFNLKANLAVLKQAEFYKHVYVLRIPSLVMGLVASLLAIVGFVRSILRRDWLLLAWLVSTVVFTVLFPAKFLAHTYYSLPFVPVLAALSAVAVVWIISLLKSKWLYWSVAGLVVVGSLGYCVWRVRPLYSSEASYYTQLESIMDGISSRTVRVVTNGGENPIMMYFSHRKGFALNAADLTIANIGILQKDKVDYLIVDKRFGLPQPQIYYDFFFLKPYEDGNFIIYYVRPPEPSAVPAQ